MANRVQMADFIMFLHDFLDLILEIYDQIIPLWYYILEIYDQILEKIHQISEYSAKMVILDSGIKLPALFPEYSAKMAKHYKIRDWVGKQTRIAIHVYKGYYPLILTLF